MKGIIYFNSYNSYKLIKFKIYFMGDKKWELVYVTMVILINAHILMQ